MNDRDFLAARFEESRPHLRAVAYRMLGSATEADDAVQEAWLRLSRSDASTIDNLGGWLTTVVSRTCLDLLRSRASRREDSLDGTVAVPLLSRDEATDPEHAAVLADSVGVALLVVLDTLAPAERLAFVLHDLFAVPFREIAPIVGRSPAATRQLASRARRRVQGEASDPAPVRPSDRPAATRPDPGRRRAIVDAFLAAARGGDMDALLTLLDPDVVVRADRAAVESGADAEVRGAAAVAGTFAGRARAARPALLGGEAGLVWAPGGRPRVAFAFTIEGGAIIAIALIADPLRLAALDVTILGE